MDFRCKVWCENSKGLKTRAWVIKQEMRLVQRNLGLKNSPFFYVFFLSLRNVSDTRRVDMEIHLSDFDG